MNEEFSFYIALALGSTFLIMLANKLKIAYPIILVIAGLALSLIPAMPVIRIDPDLIFLIFLPPILYDAAWNISGKEMWRWKRTILSFAFLVVFITAVSVAVVANAFIPGFSLAMGFVLGGIVSPPDAVSVNAILKFIKVPKRLTTILEGESLLNDASSLIVLRFAMVAVATGQFVWYKAAGDFVWMVIGGVGIGILVGWIFMKMHQKFPTDANIDAVFGIIAPFVMYLSAEYAGTSGVLGVVSGGLFLSHNRYRFIFSSSRLKSFNLYDSIIFLINGLVFLLIGLELPEIISGLQDISLWTAIGYGLLISLVLIVVRMMATFGASFGTAVMNKLSKPKEPDPPGLQVPLILGWSGMRGVISLAAALSIPLSLREGVPFPHRNLILFITFVVILTTLVVQGLTLPKLIRLWGFPKYNDYLTEEEAHAKIKKALLMQSSQLIQEKYSEAVKANPKLQELVAKWEDPEKELPLDFSQEHRDAYLHILNEQRKLILSLNKSKHKIDEDIIRKYIERIDLEEEKVRLGVI